MFFVQVAGNLGKDPETRFTPSGQKVTTFNIACNMRKAQQDITVWVRITVWGDRFDKFISFLKKGSSVIVSGKMNQPSAYTDKEGRPQAQLEVVAEALEFSPFGSGKPQQEGGAPGQSAQSSHAQPQPAQDQYGSEGQFQQRQQPYAGSYAGNNQGTTPAAEPSDEDNLPF